MTEIEKLVAFVEQTICCGDACLCPGGDCFQSMERGKAVAVIRRTLEFAARQATGFLVGDPRNGVPLRSPVPYEIAKRLRSLSPKAESNQ